jgi:hypothetical protein
MIPKANTFDIIQENKSPEDKERERIQVESFFRYARNKWRYANIAGACATATKYLLEQGHAPPYECLVSKADLALWQSVDDFLDRVHFISNDRIETASGAMRLQQTSYLPSGYFGIYKSYSQADSLDLGGPTNGVCVRLGQSGNYGMIIAESLEELDFLDKGLAGMRKRYEGNQ